MLFYKTYLAFKYWSTILSPKPLGPAMLQIQDFSEFRQQFSVTAELNGVLIATSE